MVEPKPDGRELLLRLQQLLDGEDVEFLPEHLDRCLNDHDLQLQAVPIICQEILEYRIRGEGETAILSFLMDRFKLKRTEAERLMNLASLAGTEAADVEDLIKDPSAAVDEMVYEHLVDRELAIALVNMAINMYHEKLNELNERDRRHQFAALYEGLGVNPVTVELNLKVSKYILTKLAEGRDRHEIARRLVEKEIFEDGVAEGFIDDVLLAKKASDRIRNGEDGLEVFDDLRIQDLSAYVMILALRLVEEE